MIAKKVFIFKGIILLMLIYGIISFNFVTVHAEETSNGAQEQNIQVKSALLEEKINQLEDKTNDLETELNSKLDDNTYKDIYDNTISQMGNVLDSAKSDMESMKWLFSIFGGLVVALGSIIAINDFITNRKVNSKLKAVESTKEEATTALTEATAAKTEAAAALTEANNAKTEATTALTEANNAKTEATTALTEANNAKTEATNAKIEATNAKNEATNAKNEATNAKNEATNAKTEATTAQAEANRLLLEIKDTSQTIENTKTVIEEKATKISEFYQNFDNLNAKSTGIIKVMTDIKSAFEKFTEEGNTTAFRQNIEQLIQEGIALTDEHSPTSQIIDNGLEVEVAATNQEIDYEEL